MSYYQCYLTLTYQFIYNISEIIYEKEKKKKNYFFIFNPHSNYTKGLGAFDHLRFN